MQVKDIPDQPILEFLARLEREEVVATYESQCSEAVNGIVTWYPSAGSAHIGFAQSVANAMPVDVPPKLVIAKMRSMIKRGLVDGCCCGCRGDFTLTDKGRAL